MEKTIKLDTLNIESGYCLKIAPGSNRFSKIIVDRKTLRKIENIPSIYIVSTDGKVRKVDKIPVSSCEYSIIDIH